MIEEKPLTREQKIKLHFMVGDILEKSIVAAKAEWDAIWEKRAKLSQQVDALDGEIQKAEGHLNMLKSLKEALSW